MRTVRMSPRALKLVRAYLRTRPGRGTALWVTDRGEPLTYWGAQSIFRRLKRRTGITRLHAHLCCHTFGQTALQ
jgi:site-specific recombinase XerD